GAESDPGRLALHHALASHRPLAGSGGLQSRLPQAGRHRHPRTPGRCWSGDRDNISAMRILIGVAERGAPELLAELDRLVSLLDSELVLVHVIDNGARGEMDLARGRLLPRPIPKHRLRAIGEAERRAAELALEEAA